MLTTLLTDDLQPTKTLFVSLLDFKIEFESDWFISMTGPDGGQVATMLRTSEFVPEAEQKSAQGVVITIVVDDVETYFRKATALDIDILEAPRDLPYGQRRMLIRDSSGLLLDVSSPTAPLNEQYRS